MKGTKPHLVVDNTSLDKTPSPPSWLSKEAKAEWRRVMPSLVERRILTTADLGSVENYCLAIGRARQIERLIQADGDALDPAHVRMQDKAMTTARQLAAELGLTPVSRSRPTVREKGDDDDLNPLDIS